MITQETMRCIGGPFDGQEITVDAWCLKMERLTRADETEYAAGIIAHRNTYGRKILEDGTHVWQFENSEPVAFAGYSAITRDIMPHASIDDDGRLSICTPRRAQH